MDSEYNHNDPDFNPNLDPDEKVILQCNECGKKRKVSPDGNYSDRCPKCGGVDWDVVEVETVAELTNVLAEILRPPQPKPERYFVLVLRAENLDAGFFEGSTVVGNAARDCEIYLPDGCKVVRSIEVTKRFAMEEIR